MLSPACDRAKSRASSGRRSIWKKARSTSARKSPARPGEARIIELRPNQENLIAWLRKHYQPFGPVLDPAITRIDNLLRRSAKRAGLTWKQNALRGSCASYLFALTSNLGHVARQLGNSGGTLKREYLAAKTVEDAQAWFGIAPAAEDNEIPLGLTWKVRG